MENKIVPGPFVDKLISDYLKIPKKKYSTNANSAMSLLARFVNDTPSGFSINYIKQLNSQKCEVTLFRNQNNYQASDGYLPMTICKLFINHWIKPLKFYSFEFLKMEWLKYKEIQMIYDSQNYERLSELEIEILHNFHPDLPYLMEHLNDNQIKALIHYAK